MKIDFTHAVTEHHKAIESVLEQSDKVTQVVERILNSIAQGGKVIWLGNGGSAADAQHMAAELMVRYIKNRQPIASLALTTDSSILTAHSNDFHFDTVFSRQIQGLAKPEDVIIAMSTSGNSPNVINAVAVANKIGCFTVAMTGQTSSQLSAIAQICFQINTQETARAQEAHSFINHLICEGLDSVYEEE